MKPPFILDENIIWNSAKVVNEKGVTDASSLKLWKALLENCNSIHIPIGYEFKFLHILTQLKKANKNIAASIFDLYHSLWSIEGKLNVPETPPSPLPEDTKYHDDDVDFIRLAAMVDHGIIIATTDNRLRNKLNKLGMPRKYNFRIMRPESAISHINE